MNKIENPISISNIAWPQELDEEIGNLLIKQGVHFIDVAPSKYFKNFQDATKEEINKVKENWKNRGIQIYGMQSLMYGVNKLNLFTSETDRKLMYEHLKAVCRIGQGLGARYLTFGSPKNRLIGEQTKEEISDISFNFFYELGRIAKDHDLIFCLEPNPKEYGANFLVKTEEVIEFIKKLNHPNVLMQFDTGTSILNKEENFNGMDFLLIGHIHASTPFLFPIDNKTVECVKNKLNLLGAPKEKIICIEMLCKDNNRLADTILNAIKLLRS